MCIDIDRPDSEYADHPGNPYHDDFVDAQEAEEATNEEMADMKDSLDEFDMAVESMCQHLDAMYAILNQLRR